MKYKTDPWNIFKGLMVFILILLCANIMSALDKLDKGLDISIFKTRLFDFDQELNLPTSYSTITLLICAFLLFNIYQKTKRSAKRGFPWLLLSLLFLFLAVDEFAAIHETLVPVIRETYGLSGFLYYSWVLPYGIAAILLGIIFTPFVLKLPNKIRTLFIVSAVVYVGGAVGMELLGGRQDDLYGKKTALYVTYYTFEEFLEMVGIAIFIYALLVYTKEFLASGKAMKPLKETK